MDRGKMRSVRAVARRSRAAVFAAAVAWTGCGGSPAAPMSAASMALTPVPATAEWPASTLDAERIDATRVGDLVGRIRGGTYGTITSLLVARNGRLVVEEYFNGGSQSAPHTMQSVSKSVTSLIAGIAIDQGRLGLDDRVVAWLPRYQPLRNDDPRKDAMTVRDLLTMRTGLDWYEDPYAGSALQRLNDCGCDWLRFVLDWPMRDPPGSRWEYVSGGVILLGGIVGEATGMRIDRFADLNLFGPLEAQGVSWFGGLPDGLPHTGGGLFLRSRDMAKLGQLVLDDGRWRGRQIVSSDWMRRSTARVVPSVRTFGSHPVDYGLLWWTTNPSDVVTASGARGQWIFVLSRERVVVAATGQNDNGFWSAPVDFLYSHILPAIQS